jgi:hypothetical protein
MVLALLCQVWLGVDQAPEMAQVAGRGGVHQDPEREKCVAKCELLILHRLLQMQSCSTCFMHTHDNAAQHAQQAWRCLMYASSKQCSAAEYAPGRTCNCVPQCWLCLCNLLCFYCAGAVFHVQVAAQQQPFQCRLPSDIQAQPWHGGQRTGQCIAAAPETSRSSISHNSSGSSKHVILERGAAQSS